MAISLKPGARLFSAVCATEMIAVKAPSGEVDLTIGGAPPVSSPAERAAGGAVADGHGSQCGFCTPGFVMSLFGLYKTDPSPDRAAVNDALARLADGAITGAAVLRMDMV